MNTDDFRFKGVLASSMGVLVTEQVGYQKPQEAIERVRVPGRAAPVTPLGSGGWEQVQYSPKCAVRPGSDMEAIRTWLQGRGAVIFGSMSEWEYDSLIEPEYQIKAIVDGDLEGWHELQPTFVCDPCRYLATPQTPITISNPSGTQTVTVTNHGNIDAQPLIRIEGLDGSVTITLNGTAFTLDAGTGPISFMVDCELMECHSIYGALQSFNNKMTGDFPTLGPGANFLTVTVESLSSCSYIQITPNDRSI